MCEEHVRQFGWWQRFCLTQLLRWLAKGELPICHEGTWETYTFTTNYSGEYKWAIYLTRITDEDDQFQPEDVSTLAPTETGQE